MSQVKETTVVGLERKGGVIVQGCDIYIGRFWKLGGWDLPESKWGNPYKVGSDGTLEEVLVKYEARVRGNPELMAALPELRGKVLGCFCKQAKKCRNGIPPCHGDVLVKLLKELDNAPQKKPRLVIKLPPT